MSHWFMKLLKKDLFVKLMGFWPPYWGTGIWVKNVSSDLKDIEVIMKQHPWNTNYRRSHFGGSMYSMVDPFFMLMLQHNLGGKYSVWDYSSDIQHLLPGKGTLKSHFKLSDRRLESIEERLQNENAIKETFDIDIMSGAEVIAKVSKKIHIIKRPSKVIHG